MRPKGSATRQQANQGGGLNTHRSMSDDNTSETIEFLVGVWLGVVAIYLSWEGVLPSVVFNPDGILSITAGFAAGFGYPKVAEVVGYLALVLLAIGLVLLLRQGMS